MDYTVNADPQKDAQYPDSEFNHSVLVIASEPPKKALQLFHKCSTSDATMEIY